MRFNIGDRVIKSDKALGGGILPRQSMFRKGTVIGFGNQNRISGSQCVRVKWDGTKSSMTIHEDFVQKFLRCIKHKWDKEGICEVCGIDFYELERGGED